MNTEQNELYPIFLKVHQLNVLLVGGGNVGLEKLHFMLKSSPNAQIEVVSKEFLPELVELANKHKVKLTQDTFQEKYLDNKYMAIVATDSEETNLEIYHLCKKRNLLVNLCDNPKYCDFYLGGIVTKGHLKMAISTNGKSPTVAKRLRQFFEEVIPDDINSLVENLNEYRKTLKATFEEKVENLNELTKDFLK